MIHVENSLVSRLPCSVLKMRRRALCLSKEAMRMEMKRNYLNTIHLRFNSKFFEKL
jgi:hypothetical protein